MQEDLSQIQKAFTFSKMFPIVFALLILTVGLVIGYFFGKKAQLYQDSLVINKLSNSLNTQGINLTNKINDLENTSKINANDPCQENQEPNLYFLNLRDSGCEVRVFYEWGSEGGYSLIYPSDWTARLRGAATTNLSLHKEDAELVFISVSHSDVPFELYDTIGQEFELSEPTPIINASDKVQNKSTITVGTKKVMVLKTFSENGDATYYLFDNNLQRDKSVYSIRASKDVTPETALNLIKSFVPRYY